ncbi:MAG: hypothetical protein V1659_05820 [Candidatus Woesearchaeota archaeon]
MTRFSKNKNGMFYIFIALFFALVIFAVFFTRQRFDVFSQRHDSDLEKAGEINSFVKWLNSDLERLVSWLTMQTNDADAAEQLIAGYTADINHIINAKGMRLNITVLDLWFSDIAEGEHKWRLALQIDIEDDSGIAEWHYVRMLESE